MLKIKRVRYMQLKRHLKLVLLGLVLTFGLFSGTVNAAGSAVITVELSAGSVQTDGNVTLSFYATPSGASVYSAQINVNLTNLTFQSYSSAGSPMTGSNSVAVGGSVGSTSFTIVTSYSGPGGSSSKTLMGRVTAKAGSSAGTGQITLSGADAYDNTGDPMTASSQNASVTITAPPTPPPPSGGGGSGGGGSGGGGSNPANPSNPTTPASNPNPASEVAAGGETMTEQEYSIVTANYENGDVPDEVATTTTKKSSLGKFAAVGAGLIGALAIIAGVMLFLKHRANSLAGGMISGSTTLPVNGDADTAAPTTPEKPQPSDKDGNGPTIIHPQK